jgi:hypothetical protein
MPVKGMDVATLYVESASNKHTVAITLEIPGEAIGQ